MSETNKPIVLGALKTILTPLKELIKQTDSVALQALEEAQEAKAALEGSLVQPDWNQMDSTAPDYVKNRTHYEGTRTIDIASVEATVIVAFNPGASSQSSSTVGGMVKVSDLTPDSDIVVATGKTNSSSTGKNSLRIVEESEHGVTMALYTSRGQTKTPNAVAIVYSAGHAVCSAYDRQLKPSTEYFAVLNEPGIYVNYEGNNQTATLRAIDSLTWIETVPLDEKFIPDTIARVADAETEDDALEMLTEMGIVDPVTNEEDNIFTDEDGNIFTV